MLVELHMAWDSKPNPLFLASPASPEILKMPGRSRESGEQERPGWNDTTKLTGQSWRTRDVLRILVSCLWCIEVHSKRWHILHLCDLFTIFVYFVFVGETPPPESGAIPHRMWQLACMESTLYLYVVPCLYLVTVILSCCHTVILAPHW